MTRVPFPLKKRPTRPHTEERLYTFVEAMDYLRVSRSTMNRFLASGKITGRKVGNCWRFTKDDLNAIVKDAKQGV